MHSSLSYGPRQESDTVWMADGMLYRQHTHTHTVWGGSRGRRQRVWEDVFLPNCPSWSGFLWRDEASHLVLGVRVPAERLHRPGLFGPPADWGRHRDRSYRKCVLWHLATSSWIISALQEDTGCITTLVPTPRMTRQSPLCSHTRTNVSNTESPTDHRHLTVFTFPLLSVEDALGSTRVLREEESFRV